jgi:hypothetical protein
MMEADWDALEKSHQEKVKQWEREKAELRRQQQREWDEEDREFREREHRLMKRTRRELGLASEVIKIAKTILGTSSLDGMNRRQAARKVSEVLKRHTKGFFRDESWMPVNATWKALTDEGIDWTLEKSFYNSDSQTRVPTSKTWEFWVDFQNEKGRPMKLYGVIVAAGAGSVEDPLSRYDIVAYVS